jgi:selenocysteine lyase/cysteine desulfurase
MSPLMKSVQDAGIKGVLRKQKPQQISGSDFFEEADTLRTLFARLINTDEPDRCVIIPSVSYGFANVANNLTLSENDEILVIDAQFPSNVYPWIRTAESSGATIKTVKAPAILDQRGKHWNKAVTDHINDKTKLVACSHIHWTDGTKFDLKAIRNRATEVGALLVIDATQSLGALPFSVKDIQPDALIAAGYKSLMGPYSIGMAYYGPEFDQGIPIEENWMNRFESHNFANLDKYQKSYQPHALRYEVGEHSNFILVPMMIEALKRLLEWQPNQVEKYCNHIVSNALARLKDRGFFIEEAEYRASNLFGVRLPDALTMQAVKDQFEKQRIHVSYRGDCIRVSPNVYNTEQELDYFAESLVALL